jgi:hypothetical protein
MYTEAELEEIIESGVLDVVQMTELLKIADDTSYLDLSSANMDSFNEQPSSTSLHAGQSIVFSDMFLKRDIRFATVAASRGFGKTVLAAACAVTAVDELNQLPAWIPNKKVGIVCPTYDQAVDIYYPLLAYQFGLEGSADKASRDAGVFRFHNQTELRLISGDAIERMRGKGYYFVIVDELPTFNMKEKEKLDAIEAIIMPCINTRWSPKMVRILKEAILKATGESIEINPGRLLSIASPKTEDTFFKLYENGGVIPGWKSYHYDYTKSPYLDQDEIAKAADTMDQINFNREYKAMFQDTGANVFYNFNKQYNVLPAGSVVAAPNEDLHISIDFNIRKQCSGVWVVRGQYACCIGYLQGSYNTDALGQSIYKKYVNEHRSARQIHCYPDPSGKAGHTNAPIGQNDLTILEGFGFDVRAMKNHPSISDSVKATNARFKTADNPITKKPGKRYAFILADCKPVIDSVTKTQWLDKNPDTATIDKSMDIEHFSDGIRYMFSWLWPMTGARVATRGFNF